MAASLRCHGLIFSSASLSSDIIIRAKVTIPIVIYELRLLEKSIGIFNKMGISKIGSFSVVWTFSGG